MSLQKQIQNKNNNNKKKHLHESAIFNFCDYKKKHQKIKEKAQIKRN